MAIKNFFLNLTKLFYSLRYKKMAWAYLGEIQRNCDISPSAKIYPPSSLNNVKVGFGSYISQNGRISETTIGKFCSIGSDFICGWGIHPTDGISTSPMFYSTLKQNGFSLVKGNKIQERKSISIGNDVFIGARVTILDGMTIGDGAVIAAGCVVNQDVPPFAVVGGIPGKVIKYRFEEDVINKLLAIKWWDWEEDKLSCVEEDFFEVESFIKKYSNS